MSDEIKTAKDESLGGVICELKEIADALEARLFGTAGVEKGPKVEAANKIVSYRNGIQDVVGKLKDVLSGLDLL